MTVRTFKTTYCKDYKSTYKEFDAWLKRLLFPKPCEAIVKEGAPNAAA